jgi:hypothetical protein
MRAVDLQFAASAANNYDNSDGDIVSSGFGGGGGGVVRRPTPLPLPVVKIPMVTVKSETGLNATIKKPAMTFPGVPNVQQLIKNATGVQNPKIIQTLGAVKTPVVAAPAVKAPLPSASTAAVGVKSPTVATVTSVASYWWVLVLAAVGGLVYWAVNPKTTSRRF